MTDTPLPRRDAPKLYPMQIEHQLTLPRHYVIRFTEKQARMIFDKYHEQFKGQSFEQLFARGGFGVLEAIYFLTGDHVDIETLPTGAQR